MRKVLTLDELREMEGNPVLVEMKNEIEREHNGVYISLYDKQMKAIRLWGVDGAWLRFSEKDMKVYAYTDPPRLDRSAWEPCKICVIRSMVESLVRKRMKFCAYCGRPLTDEAWQMLEERMGVETHENQ